MLRFNKDLQKWAHSGSLLEGTLVHSLSAHCQIVVSMPAKPKTKLPELQKYNTTASQVIVFYVVALLKKRHKTHSFNHFSTFLHLFCLKLSKHSSNTRPSPTPPFPPPPCFPDPKIPVPLAHPTPLAAFSTFFWKNVSYKA